MCLNLCQPTGVAQSLDLNNNNNSNNYYDNNSNIYKKET